MIAVGLMAYTGNESLYRNFIMPLVCLIDPERAHHMAVKAAKHRFVPNIKQPDVPSLVRNLSNIIDRARHIPGMLEKK